MSAAAEPGAGAVIHRPGDGEIHAAGPSRIVIKATGNDTAGAFFLSENTIAPGFSGPPLHRHRSLVDMFYVLEGTLTVRVDDETHELPAGSFVCAPPGVPHTFANTSEGPVRFLNFSTPAGWEHYMRDLATAMGSGPITPEIVGALASRHDLEVL